MTNVKIPMTSIVITGGKGFVGKYLREELEKNWQGVEMDIWDPVKSADADHGASLPVDITKPEKYRDRLKKLQPDWLVHLAAVSSVLWANKNPELTHRVNVEASQNILEAVRELSPATKVLVISTADIYGSPLRQGFAGQAPLSELSLDQCQPQNPYGQSKWEMEKIIEQHFRERCIRVRPFPHIGPGQGLGFVTADFASQIAEIEKGKQKPVMKVGNLKAKRDFTDVRDVARAYRLLMEKGKLGEVYHTASGKAVSIQGILDELLAMSSVKISVQEDPSRLRASDTPVLVGDAAKLKEATGWKPTIPLAQSLQDILNWWRKQA